MDESPQAPSPQPNRMIRRRTSVQNDSNMNDIVSNIDEPKLKMKSENNSKINTNTTEANESFLLRSESYTYDSDENDGDKVDQQSKNDPKSRKLTFANTKYLLNSFESGHWSMMGGINDGTT